MGTRVINTVKSSKLHRQIQPSMCLKLRAAIHVVEFQDRIEKAAKLIFRHLYIETVLVLAYLGYCARVNKKKKKVNICCLSFSPVNVIPLGQALLLTHLYTADPSRTPLQADQKYNSFFLKCCRKEDPFQGPSMGFCPTLRNELSEETCAEKQKTLLGRGAQEESSRGGNQENCSARGSQSQALREWG